MNLSTTVNIVEQVKDSYIENSFMRKDLDTMVYCEDSANDFETFVLENPDLATEFSILKAYREKLIDELSDGLQMLNAVYPCLSGIFDKKKLLEGLFFCHFDVELVEEFDRRWQNKEFTLYDFHQKKMRRIHIDPGKVLRTI